MTTRMIPWNAQLEVVPDEVIHSDLIATPDSAKERDRPTSGVITAMGPRVTGFVEGDRVAFDTKSGWEYSVSGEKYMVLDQTEIVGALVDEEDVGAAEIVAGVYEEEDAPTS